MDSERDGQEAHRVLRNENEGRKISRRLRAIKRELTSAFKDAGQPKLTEAEQQAIDMHLDAVQHHSAASAAALADPSDSAASLQMSRAQRAVIASRAEVERLVAKRAKSEGLTHRGQAGVRKKPARTGVASNKTTHSANVSWLDEIRAGHDAA